MHRFKKGKNKDAATPRKSARNIEKLAAEIGLKSDMEIELENLEKQNRPSKIPKKSLIKKIIDSDVEVKILEEVVQGSAVVTNEIKIKKSTPKKIAKMCCFILSEWNMNTKIKA